MIAEMHAKYDRPGLAPEQTIDDVLPIKKLCTICQRINPRSLKLGLEHHRLQILKESTRDCHFCMELLNILCMRIHPESARSLQVFLDDMEVKVADSQSGNVYKKIPWNVFTDEFDPAAGYGIKYRRRLTTTRSNESFAIASAWLNECLGPVQDATWLTTKANLDSRSRGFERLSLPKTLWDALFIAEKLGLRYLWIDAICIVQDDEDEWELEGARMAGIYSGALVTIAAASSSSSHDGIFNTRSTTPLRCWGGLFRLESELSNGQRSQLYFQERSPLDPWMGPLHHVRSGPLASRARCFQERALSPRILYYTSCHLLWRCEHSDRADSLRAEDGLDTLWSTPFAGEDAEVFPTDLDARTLSTGDVVRVWYGTTVPAYTKGKLTYDSDKLIAISALAEAIQVNCGDDYVAGLWRKSLISGLLWARRGPGAKTTAYRCPSWSWASQNSSIGYELPEDVDNELRDGDFAYDCEVLAAEVETGKHNAFGNVRSGYLRLKVSLVPAWVWRQPVTHDSWSNEEYKCSLSMWDGSRPTSLPAYMDDENWVSGHVVCALIGNQRLLILRPVDLAPGNYTRVGISTWSNRGVRRFWPEQPSELWQRRIQQAMKTEITII
ncbi:hypothetical protein PG984_004942 [Apiospora sp. TS-2023a]